MNPEYIRKIEELLGEMRKKQMDPVGKADADIDNDGDVDSSDKYLHKRRKAIAKSMKKEGEGKVTPCPKCNGSMENHEPECPLAKSESCGSDHKKPKKEEVEQVSEVSANHSVYGHKTDGTKKVIGRAHGSDEKEAVSNFHSSPNNGQFKNVYKSFSAKRDHVEYNNQPVVSEQWGFGEVIETTDEGLNVYFDHGVEFNVPASSLTFLEDKKHTKGATKPEGLLDKESPRSRQFVKDHEKSDKEIEDKEMKGHEDATKAGRVTKQAPARRGEKRVGDTKIVNPVQGAVTQTTGKE